MAMKGINRFSIRILRALCRRSLREESGQAVVESAIVIPLMTFLILGVIQLAMMQHARIMTEYAAFNAARAGIVWNADNIIMENAAIISLLPTYEGLFDQADLGNPEQMLKRIAQRALLYQVNNQLPKAVDLLKNGTSKILAGIPGKVGEKVMQGKDKILDAAALVADTELQSMIKSSLGSSDLRFVQVNILNPHTAMFGANGREIDFDDFSKLINRTATRLSIEVQYLYMLRIPFANWIIHQAWLAGSAGKQLYGAIWNAQENMAGETGFRENSFTTSNFFADPLLSDLAGIAQSGTYMVPLRATYTMRMQSNPYKQSLQLP